MIIDTNALLSIALSLATQFTNTVPTPSQVIPAGTNNVRQYLIGSPRSPLDVYFTLHNGVEFWIEDGAITQFRTPGSYFSLQEPERVPKFLGSPQFTSNQVFEIAERTMRRLIKSGEPLAGLEPKIQAAGHYKGQAIPFYEVSWPVKNTGYREAASIEIDARTGGVTSLMLWHVGFRDTAFAQKVSNQVAKAETPVKSPGKSVLLGNQNPKFRQVFPVPPTNVVEKAISHWLTVCQKLRIEPGKQTNLTDVDWEASGLFSWDIASTNQASCRVRFHNGTQFDSLDSLVLGHLSWDACFKDDWQARPHEQWKEFEGFIGKNWEDLAKQFTRLLIETYSIPEELLGKYDPGPFSRPPELGSIAIRRFWVHWREWPRDLNPEEFISVEESKLGLMVEFDLQTGEVKGFGFKDPELLRLFREGQLKAK